MPHIMLVHFYRNRETPMTGTVQLIIQGISVGMYLSVCIYALEALARVNNNSHTKGADMHAT